MDCICVFSQEDLLDSWPLLGRLISQSAQTVQGVRNGRSPNFHTHPYIPDTPCMEMPTLTPQTTVGIYMACMEHLGT